MENLYISGLQGKTRTISFEKDTMRVSCPNLFLNMRFIYNKYVYHESVTNKCMIYSISFITICGTPDSVYIFQI